MSYAVGTVLDRPFDVAVTAVREALAAQGFGVLTEIDLSGTLRTKLGVEVPRQLLLGACNPALAHRALQAEETIGLLLPCTVAVRDLGGDRTAVDVLDPHVMGTLTGNPEVAAVADDAAARLDAARAALTALTAPPA